MASIDDLKALGDSLKEKRDHLRVQLNLAGKEARDEWDELEGKWDAFRAKLDVIKQEVSDVSDDAVDATEYLGNEIKEGYSRLKSRLK